MDARLPWTFWCSDDRVRRGNTQLLVDLLVNGHRTTLIHCVKLCFDLKVFGSHVGSGNIYLAEELRHKLTKGRLTRPLVKIAKIFS